MRAVLLFLFVEGLVARPPLPPGQGLGLRPRVISHIAVASGLRLLFSTCCAGRKLPAMPLSALALLVAQVLADDHDPTVATNDLAFVADRLDARLDLHGRG